MLFLSKSFAIIIQYKVQLLWLISFILVSYFIYYSINNAPKHTHGFASYFTASKLLVQGEDPAEFYDEDYFSSMVVKYVPGVYEIYLVNPPTTVLIALPFSGFDYKTARVIWIFLNILLLGLTIGYLLVRMNFGNVSMPFASILLLSFQPLYANIKYGQIYILLFCFSVFIFISFESAKEKLPGILLGAILVFKSAGTFLIFLFAIKKRWKSMLWIFVTVVLVFLITIPALGLESWLAYLSKLIDYSDNPELSVTAYQTIHSFFHHFFVYDKQWNAEPIINSAILGKSLSILSSLIILTLTALSAYKSKRNDLTFGMFITAGLVLTPATIDYHYVLILIPVFIIVRELAGSTSRMLWSIFIISFLLLASSIPYTSPKVTSGIWSVFAYPKLYGSLILLGLTIKISFVDGNGEKQIIKSVG